MGFEPTTLTLARWCSTPELHSQLEIKFNTFCRLHNILEAIAFGSYVLFGPKFHNYEEAKEVIRKGIGQSIKNEDELEKVIKQLIENKHNKNDALDFISEKKGANKIIVNTINNGKILGI